MQPISDLVDAKILLLGSNNRKKIVELVNLLEPRGFTLRTPSDFPDSLDVEETGSTFMENARLKAIAQATHRGMWAIGEDSGLCVKALDHRPGIYSARFSGENATDQSNNDLLLQRMKSVPDDQRQAYYVSTSVLAAYTSKRRANVGDAFLTSLAAKMVSDTIPCSRSKSTARHLRSWAWK